MSSVIVAKAYVILAFKFVISGTGVENTLSITYPHKKKSRLSDHLSHPLHLFGNVASKNRRTCEPQCGGAPSCCKIIHGWNSSEVQRKVPTSSGKHLFVIRERHYAHPVYREPCKNVKIWWPCRYVFILMQNMKIEGNDGVRRRHLALNCRPVIWIRWQCASPWRWLEEMKERKSGKTKTPSSPPESPQSE